MDNDSHIENNINVLKTENIYQQKCELQKTVDQAHKKKRYDDLFNYYN